jgi:hypothetical protein
MSDEDFSTLTQLADTNPDAAREFEKLLREQHRSDVHFNGSLEPDGFEHAEQALGVRNGHGPWTTGGGRKRPAMPGAA